MFDVNRSSFYYVSKPIRAQDLELMRLTDEQYMKTPTYGSRSMRNFLRRLGYKISRKRIQRLMRLMGLEAIYPKPNTSRPHPQHKVYPYLLKNMTIDRANQVWSTDITYIPMARGFMHLVAVMDWHSRKVLSFRLSNTLPIFVLKHSTKPWIFMGHHRFLIPIRELSLPAQSLPTPLKQQELPSAWTAGAGPQTIFLSNGSGGRSNIIIFTCIHLTPAAS